MLHPACLFARLSLLGSAGWAQVIFLGFRAFSSGSAPGAPGSGACPPGSGAFPGAGISACSSPTPFSPWLVIHGHSISGGGVLCRPARGSLLSQEEASKAERQERCTACAALPLPQSTLSSEPSSTPRLLWPPSRRAPVVPIRVCQHDDANRRNGQETEIGDRAGEG